MRRETLLQLDAELRDRWQIDFRSFEQPQWWDSLFAEIGTERGTEFRHFFQSYSHAVNDGSTAIEDGEEKRQLERLFYEAIAVDPLCGFVHSNRRSIILDSAALAEGLIEQHQLSGRVLDVGCHAGYLATWLARHDTLQVTAADVCLPALELGERRCRELGRSVTFLDADVLADDLGGPYELILAIDALPDVHEAGVAGLLHLAGYLAAGGLLVLATCDPLDVVWPPLSRVSDRLQEAGLGFLFADCLGGCPGEDLELIGENVFVFRNGEPSRLPEDCVAAAQRRWPEFLEYTADPAVPGREKTQAWYRSQTG